MQELSKTDKSWILSAVQWLHSRLNGYSSHLNALIFIDFYGLDHLSIYPYVPSGSIPSWLVICHNPFNREMNKVSGGLYNFHMYKDVKPCKVVAEMLCVIKHYFPHCYLEPQSFCLCLPYSLILMITLPNLCHLSLMGLKNWSAFNINHLADTFHPKRLPVQGKSASYQHVCSLGIQPMTLVSSAPGTISSSKAAGTPYLDVHVYYRTVTIFHKSYIWGVIISDNLPYLTGQSEEEYAEKNDTISEASL